MAEEQAAQAAQEQAQDTPLDLARPVDAMLLAIVIAAVNEGDDFSDDSVQLILESAGMDDVWRLAVDLTSDEELVEEEALDDPEPEEE